MPILRSAILNGFCYLLLAVFMVIAVLQMSKTKQVGELYADLSMDSFMDRTEATAVATEEQVLTALMHNEERKGLSLNWGAGSGGDREVAFLMLMTPENCSNVLETDLRALNAMYNDNTYVTVRGYYVSNSLEYYDDFVSMYDFDFPVEVGHPWPEWPEVGGSVEGGGSTPLVVVVDVQRGAVLDVHQPIPDDVQKSLLFYSRWERVLALSS